MGIRRTIWTISAFVLFLGGLVAAPVIADVLSASSQPGTVRIYNPQDFAQSGTVRVTPLGQAPGGADVIIPYTLPAHNVGTITVGPGLVRVTPDTVQGTQEPNPVVDFETNPEGGIASPTLFTDLAVKHATGNGTGNVLIIGNEGGQLIVSQYQNGKPTSASTLALPQGGAITAPVNGTFSVDFLNGSGAVAFENGEQRTINSSHSLLSNTAAWWVKPSSTVLKPSTTEVRNIVTNDATTFATYLSQDSAFLTKFGSVDMIAENLRRWTDVDATNGEFTAIPIKVAGETMYFMLSSSADVTGLSSKKVPTGYKVTVNAPNGREAMLALLGDEIERNPSAYYSTVDPSTRPNALWAKKKMNTSITGAPSLAAEGSLLVPYMTADTKVTLTNASPFSATYTVSTAAMGSDPRTGNAQTVSLQPGASQTFENLVSADNSAYIKTTGNKPAVSATRPGLDIPVLPEEYANNTQPMANIVQSGEEIAIKVTGQQPGNALLNYKGYGPSGSGDGITGPQISLLSNIVTENNVNVDLGALMPQNSSVTMIPDTVYQSKVGSLLLFENSANLDQRIRAGQNVSVSTTMTPQVYVDTYFKPSTFLSNWEWGSLMRGDAGTRSYAQDVATILFNHANPQPPGDIASLTQPCR